MSTYWNQLESMKIQKSNEWWSKEVINDLSTDLHSDADVKKLYSREEKSFKKVAKKNFKRYKCGNQRRRRLLVGRQGPKQKKIKINYEQLWKQFTSKGLKGNGVCETSILEKVDVISADQMALDYEKSIKAAEDQIHNLA